MDSMGRLFGDGPMIQYFLPPYHSVGMVFASAFFFSPIIGPIFSRAYRVMATSMSALPYYKESVFLPLSTRSRSRLLLVSYFHFGYKYSLHRRLCFFFASVPAASHSRRMKWSLQSMVDDSSSDPSESGASSNGTRLLRIFQSLRTKLNGRIKDLRKGLSLKIFFFLVGFYCATAFATVIGQTGDWDIISAGLAVVVVEGIGALMYSASSRLFDRARNLITMFNYWKAGLSLGLFLDSFKYEVNMLIESCNPLGIDIDVFPSFW